MKRWKLLLLLCFCFLFALVSLALARKTPKGKYSGDLQIQSIKPNVLNLDHTFEEEALFATLQSDTTWLAFYNFENMGNCSDEGWTSHDLTSQTGCYFHIDDFAGLAGGDFGRLFPIEGDQSVWCGARWDPVSEVLCSYATLPGYGNNWDQSWCSPCFRTDTLQSIFLDYHISWDSEPAYDYTYVEYAEADSCDDLENIEDILAWNVISSYESMGSATVHDTIPAIHKGALRIRFHFVSDGGWSDQDGIYNSDGAVIIDSVIVRDMTTVYSFDDYEDESPGDLQAIAVTPPDQDSVWVCSEPPGYGDFADLYYGTELLQEGDRCNFHTDCMWAFIKGSTDTYAWGGFPGQLVVPYGNARGQYIMNEIWSPKIPCTGGGTSTEIRWEVYKNLPVTDCVFYRWHVRSWVGGCSGGWKDRGLVHYGTEKDWVTDTQVISDLIDPGATDIQIALGVWDMCGIWGGIYCRANCGVTGISGHTHSPIFTNVEVYRIDTTGPQWSVLDIDLFQDTFSSDSTSWGTGRADAAVDVDGPGPILPQDWAIATCRDPIAGLDTVPVFGGPAVYCWVTVLPQGQPGKAGTALSNNLTRWPFVGSATIPSDLWGTKPSMNLIWDCFRMDKTGGGPDEYCISLNDWLFTPGDMILFFFHARSNGGVETFWSEFTGTTFKIREVANDPMEFQILPGPGALVHGGDILYVDDFDGRGAQPYFDWAFDLLGISDQVDRYDVRAPSSCVSNSPGGGPTRLGSVTNQVIPFYRKIIWNSGDLGFGTIGDGILNELADDWWVLHDFLFFHTSPVGSGIYISGDDIADEWAGLIAWSFAFRSFMPHRRFAANHVPLHGVSPFVVGTVGGIFDHGVPMGVEKMVAYGGCPVTNDFDQIVPLASATLEMTYSNSPLPTDGAVVAYDTLNFYSNPVAVVLSGFSYHYIRDDQPAGMLDRVHHLWSILQYLRNIINDPTGADPQQLSNSLGQNYPNPFNPTTAIEYSIKERAHVSLKIYNVAGQLVKTLVNEEQHPRSGGYNVRWNGKSDAGDPVSSGVYFYKLETKNFTQTKKMILIR